jgi:hypothetical protein
MTDRENLISLYCRVACRALLHLVQHDDQNKWCRTSFVRSLDNLSRLHISGLDILVNGNERWLIGFNKPDGLWVFDVEVHYPLPLKPVHNPHSSSQFFPSDLDRLIVRLRNPPVSSLAGRSITTRGKPR